MQGRYVLADDPDAGPDFLVTSRIRRCNGCSTCITSSPGRCSQYDALSPEIPRILSSDVLVIDSAVDGDMVRMPMRKAVERLSNIFLAWTDAGWNVPQDIGMTSLREIVVSCAGEGSEEFEHYMREMLLKGPVQRISFEYKRKNRD
ncbi:MAG: hypothetical protein II933_04925 [Candidatus Methanomethylophilaceae archaeon]|nr:hypothetical protein [Candidatus Methanomethylophilaceae archaeon]